MTEELDDQLLRLDQIDVPAPQSVAALRQRAARRRRRRIGTRAVAAVSLVGLAIGLVAANDDPRSKVDSVDDRVDTDPSPAWRPLPPSPIAGRFAAASATDGRRMFIWGGLDGSRQHSFSDGAIYDPATDAWETVPDAPEPMQGPNGKAVWDGARFLVLEADMDTPLALAAYDPSTRQWERLADPPLDQREGFNATWTGTELIVSGGGAGDTIADTFAAAYDPPTNEWRVLPQPPWVHYTGGAAISAPPGVMVFGGVANASGASAEPQTAVPGVMYTSASPGGWTMLPNGPVANPRWAIPTEDGIVVVGDEEGLGTRLGVGVFRPSALAWAELPSIESPSPAIAVVADGRGGFVVLTDIGGIRGNDRPGTDALPRVDLAGRVVPSVVVAGDTLVVWGGLNDAQTGALGDGFSLFLEHGSRPTLQPPTTAPAAARVDACGSVPFLPTWLPEQWPGALRAGRGGESGVEGPGHWAGPLGRYLDVISGDSAVPLAAGTTTRLDSLAGAVEVGEIEDGYGARLDLRGTPCPARWSLEGFGLTRQEFERVVSSLVSTTEGFAIWPQDTAAAAAERGRVEAGQARLQDGRAAALQFASQVLGWNEARVTDSEPSEDGRFGGNYSVEREPGGPTVGISAAPLVDARYEDSHWYVYRVGGAPEGRGASVRVGDGTATVRAATDRAHASAELRIGHGGREVTATAPSADFAVDLDDVDATGHLLVIWRDGAGAAVDAFGIALPSRVFAAG